MWQGMVLGTILGMLLSAGVVWGFSHTRQEIDLYERSGKRHGYVVVDRQRGQFEVDRRGDRTPSFYGALHLGRRSQPPAMPSSATGGQLRGAARAVQTRWGVSGRSRWRMPRGASASMTRARGKVAITSVPKRSLLKRSKRPWCSSMIFWTMARPT